MLKVIRRAEQSVRQTVFRRQVVIFAEQTERTPDRFDCCGTGAFIQRDTHLGLADPPQVQPFADRRLQHTALQEANIDGDRVEIRLWFHLEASSFQPFGKADRLAMNALCNGAEAFGAVEHRVEPGHHRQKCLRGADIRRRFLATDVLLARLERQAVGLVAMAVDGNPNNPTRHGALVGIFCRHVSGVRPAIPQWHAKALGGANGDVSTHFARLLEQTQRHRVCRHDGDCLGLVQAHDVICEIAQMAVGAGILEDRAKHGVRIHLGHIANDDFDPKRCCAGLHDRDVLRVAILINEKRLGFRFRHTLRHGHGFGTGCGLIQQGCIGNLQPGQITDHGLIVQQRFQTAL